MLIARSTGIHDNWGGRPYDDLVKCLEFLRSFPFIDLDNAVAAGASYGGYMINWMQGHDLGRKVRDASKFLYETSIF